MVWAQSCGKTNHYPNPLTGGEGFIPAHAGKTSSFSWLLRRSAAHPRSRGENTCGEAVTAVSVGSSPLRRGKHVGGALQARPPRLIPAHAGKTRISVTRRRRIRAHPHSRGENKQLLVTARRSAAHPHSHEENDVHAEASIRFEGSSPLTRGKPDRVAPFAAWRWAHPHSRGKHRAEKAHPAFQKGSSPLTRGKRGAALRVPRYGGFIPAHTGKTLPSSARAATSRAHPHSRGENATIESGSGCITDSSPLTRGKQRQ